MPKWSNVFFFNYTWLSPGSAYSSSKTNQNPTQVPEREKGTSLVKPQQENYLQSLQNQKAKNLDANFLLTSKSISNHFS